MNIIIVGCGKVGLTLADHLNRENHDVTIIDKNEKALRHAVEALDVMGVLGNGAILAVQKEAGIQNADVLIAATDSDEVNMLCCLIAKKEANCNTIARIRNPEYSKEISYLRDELNLALVINPELASAREIVRLLRFPSAMKIDSFSKGKIDLIKLAVPKNSDICGMQLHEISSKLKVNVLICTIEREDEMMIPSGSSTILAGDKITFIAKPEDAVAFFKKSSIEYTPTKSCIIVGGGRITYYVAKHLQETKSKCKLKIIESNPERCNFLAEEFPNVTIINGDGSDQQLLMEEGIEHTDAFASLTGFDEENIMLSLYAGKLSRARLITKINRIAFENVTKEMNLGSVIYPKLITADIILQYVRALSNSQGSNIETLYKIADGKAEAIEFKVEDEPLIVGIPFSKLNLRRNVLVANIIRNHKIITPGGSDSLLKGDRVVIITTNTGLNDLKDILA